MQIVIASRNLNKIREYRTFFKKLDGIDVLSVMDFPDYVPMEEEGDTFEANAKAKALHAAKTLNSFVIADDSGLVIPALSGEPGVYSARYAGEGASDHENREKLLAKVKNLAEEDRTAFFDCVIAFADPNGNIRTVKGTVEGTVIDEEKGSHGFGYDPVFLKYDYSKTFGELEEEMKNQISHRRKAFEKIYPFLASLAHKKVG